MAKSSRFLRLAKIGGRRPALAAAARLRCLNSIAEESAVSGSAPEPRRARAKGRVFAFQICTKRTRRRRRASRRALANSTA